MLLSPPSRLEVMSMRGYVAPHRLLVARHRLAALILALVAGTAVVSPWSADATNGLWRSRAELADLPTSGAAWERLKSVADGSLGKADISNQSSRHDTNTFAAALVYARTGQEPYQQKVRDGIAAAIGTERGGRTLALGRNLPAYVIAADLIGLRSHDPALDSHFRSWLKAVRTQPLDGSTLIQTHEQRPNNWGAHAGAARVAASAYLGDRADLDRAAQVFKGWLGDRTTYAGFRFGALSWQCNPTEPVAINPAGCTRRGLQLDGVLPDDQRRGGGFSWPPAKENYTWEALEGATVQAELLHRQGYDAWQWQDQALRRAVRWLYVYNRFIASGDDTWIPWLVNHVYGTNFQTGPARTGKNMGFTDWTHQGRSSQTQKPEPTQKAQDTPKPEDVQQGQDATEVEDVEAEDVAEEAEDTQEAERVQEVEARQQVEELKAEDG
jgi:hypothetical protein